MKQFIEINRMSGPVCVGLPSRRVVDGYNPENLTLKVHREGMRSLLAVYPAQQAEGGKMCFLIDDDLVNAHPGWYVGTVYNCKKPIHSLRMSVPRPKFGPVTVLKMKPDCLPAKVAPCPPDVCTTDPLVAEGEIYISG